MEETNKKEVEAARADAIEKDQCFSKGRLRDEFRMKPKPEAEPVAFYKNGYGGKFGVYKISDCVPMKARSTKPPSEKQKRARAILAVKAKLKSNEAKTSCRAVQWLDENPLFLDTETTGLDDKAQILELAISDAQGSILLKTRLRPTVPIDREAEDIHGITAESLVAVGMPLTRHPPHRSVRAVLPHTAPASGDDGETARWARGGGYAVAGARHRESV